MGEAKSLTPPQRRVARHALGLDGHRRTSYRNRYFAAPESAEAEIFGDMCAAGHAVRRDPIGSLVHFALTRAGAELAVDDGESLDPEDFQNG